MGLLNFRGLKHLKSLVEKALHHLEAQTGHLFGPYSLSRLVSIVFFEYREVRLGLIHEMTLQAGKSLNQQKKIEL
jgi:hypothetical protein